MAYLEGGTFTMGSPAGEGQDVERPQHSVTLSPFCLGRTEVTVAEWTRSGRQPSHSDSACNYGRRGREDHPMNCIDWTEAEGYCRSLGQRLPTEAEWEFAASVGGTRRYPWGDSAPSNQLCWSGSRARSGTCSVGSFASGNTPSGLSDLSGNVWEWVSDWYGAYSGNSQTNPGGANSGNIRVYRGGGWGDSVPAGVRARNRARDVPTGWNGDLGVRCASAPLGSLQASPSAQDGGATADASALAAPPAGAPGGPPQFPPELMEQLRRQLQNAGGAAPH
jgi:formylglycine-generating enzyme required for sulfatase activity